MTLPLDFTSDLTPTSFMHFNVWLNLLSIKKPNLFISLCSIQTLSESFTFHYQRWWLLLLLWLGQSSLLHRMVTRCGRTLLSSNGGKGTHMFPCIAMNLLKVLHDHTPSFHAFASTCFDFWFVCLLGFVSMAVFILGWFN